MPFGADVRESVGRIVLVAITTIPPASANDADGARHDERHASRARSAELANGASGGESASTAEAEGSHVPANCARRTPPSVAETSANARVQTIGLARRATAITGLE